MLEPGTRDQLTIMRLRVKSTKLDPLVANLRLSSLLSTAQLQPAALPSSAIVFVRKLQDPLPGSMRLERSDRRLTAAWQKALEERLDLLATNAPRPAMATVPASAEAVVFLDRSELMASAANDWCEAQIATNWWWQSHLKHGDSSQLVWKLWQGSPEYVPTAMQHLANKEMATAFVKKLGSNKAHDLLLGVTRSFALHSLMRVLDRLLDGINPPSSGRAPWRRWVPESAADGLAPDQQLLLGIALTLQRAPARVRTLSFATEVERWQRQITSSERGVSEPGGKQGFATKTGGTSDARGSAESEDFGTDRSVGNNAEANLRASSLTVSQPRPPAERVLKQDKSYGDSFHNLSTNDSSDRAASLHLKEEAITASLAIDESPEGPSARDGRSAIELPEKDKNDSEEWTLRQANVARSVSTESAKTAAEIKGAGEAGTIDAVTDAFDQVGTVAARIETHYGGLLYLINLALYLELYGDFTTPASPGIQLNIWDFVALAGRELIGDQLKSDPLWQLLASLAAREEAELLGSSFEPEDEWRIPAEWLQPFSPATTAYWTTSSGRLRLLHPGGFLVLDVPLKAGNPAAQLQRELEAYEGFEFQVSNLDLASALDIETELLGRSSKFEASPAVVVWLDRLMPYVRARLRRALGTGETEDPGLVLCRHRATVCVMSIHVDIYLSLAELPVEIRFAGLDRTPGWVPAAGRFIAFYFD